MKTQTNIVSDEIMYLRFRKISTQSYNSNSNTLNLLQEIQVFMIKKSLKLLLDVLTKLGNLKTLLLQWFLD